MTPIDIKRSFFQIFALFFTFDYLPTYLGTHIINQVSTHLPMHIINQEVSTHLEVRYVPFYTMSTYNICKAVGLILTAICQREKESYLYKEQSMEYTNMIDC